MQSMESEQMLIRSINDLQVIIKDIGLRLHDLETRLKKLEYKEAEKYGGN